MSSVSSNPPLAGKNAGDSRCRFPGALAFALLLSTLAGIVFISLCQPQTLGIFSSDDSFYYFLTARNFVLGNGMSFDGINPTNGFHPLWMLAVIPLYAVTGGDYDLSLRLVYVLLLLLFTGSIALTFRLVSGLFGRIPALLTLLLFINPAVFNLFFNGLESALLMFLLLLLLNVARAIDLVSPRMGLRNQVLAGLLFGLVFLSRLDGAFHLLGLGLVAFVVYRLPLWNPKALPSLLRSYGLLFMVFALVVTPYFLWNLSANGHLSPISGALKSSFPDPEPRLKSLTALSRAPYTLFVVGSLVLAIIQLFQSRSPMRRLLATRDDGTAWGVLLGGLWVGCILHFGYTLFFTTWGTHQWHFTSYVPIALLCAGWMLGHLAALRPWLAYGVAALLLAVGVGMLFFSVTLKAKQHGNWHVAAIWAREHTPPDSIFGMTDAGYFAYFSRRSTVNLDGLINSYEYQEALANRALEPYLTRCGVDYVCDYEVPTLNSGYHRIQLNRIFYAERLKGKRGYQLAFPMDQTVYTSPPYAPYSFHPDESGGNRIVFCIWSYQDGHLIPL